MFVLHVIGESRKTFGGSSRSHWILTVKHLSKKHGLHLTFAVSYGARCELARAAKLFAEDCVKGQRQSHRK